MKKISIYTIIIGILLLAAGIATTTYGAIWIEKTNNIGPIIALAIGILLLSFIFLTLLFKFYLKLKFKKMEANEIKYIVSQNELDTKSALFAILNPIQANKLGFK